MNNETIGIPSAETMGADGAVTPRPNTSLFGIHSQLLELYQLREEASAEDPEALPAIDKAIDEYFALATLKVDKTVSVKRQFEAAAEFNKIEAKRLQARAKMFEQHADDIEQRLIRFMQAHKFAVMEGKTARLKLAKNPASVNPRQPELIPDRFMRNTVVLSVQEWDAIVDCLLLLAERAACAEDARSETYTVLARTLQDGINHGTKVPDLVPIKKEMQLQCEACTGRGWHPDHRLADGQAPCQACGGSGKRAVPGCELVTDKVRLAVS